MRAKAILPADPPNSPEMLPQIIWACFRSSEENDLWFPALPKCNKPFWRYLWCVYGVSHLIASIVGVSNPHIKWLRPNSNHSMLFWSNLHSVNFVNRCTLGRSVAQASERWQVRSDCVPWYGCTVSLFYGFISQYLSVCPCVRLSGRHAFQANLDHAFRGNLGPFAEKERFRKKEASERKVEREREENGRERGSERERAGQRGMEREQREMRGTVCPSVTSFGRFLQLCSHRFRERRKREGEWGRREREK